ncbi:hypothetical protein BLJ79_21480 [Arthrobacter sp. UCD-GKA]|uniref:hypothetical protein n=1 Tax=Arthrobacter sp. UCD-GKA TaxID=1913576 RepID=UPI0008DDEB35|nr:hypothetical protein [Arthrobacter sp. UCD-GKA]OIH81935.1 hypothetical protein BLJ79_21480 [Arthrobacter sp. UCD-GKA]
MTRTEARIAVRTALTDHFREYGQWVENLGQEVPIAALSARINKRVSVDAFEEALRVMQRRYKFDNDTTYAPDGDRGKDRRKLEEELTEHINNIAGSGPKGEK